MKKVKEKQNETTVKITENHTDSNPTASELGGNQSTQEIQKKKKGREEQTNSVFL